jgi:hypothetical protein
MSRRTQRIRLDGLSSVLAVNQLISAVIGLAGGQHFQESTPGRPGCEPLFVIELVIDVLQELLNLLPAAKRTTHESRERERKSP